MTGPGDRAEHLPTRRRLAARPRRLNIAVVAVSVLLVLTGGAAAARLSGVGSAGLADPGPASSPGPAAAPPTTSPDAVLPDSSSAAGASSIPTASPSSSATPTAKPSTSTATRTATKKPNRSPSTSTSKSSAGTTTSGGSSSTAREVLRLTNVERAKAGCGPLAWNSTLASVAQAHSNDMRDRGYFSHNSLDGRSPFDRMRAAGYVFRTAAENIAAGQSSAASVMSSWMNSSGHRANILNCSLKELGVGVARGGSYRVYWTQDFGTR